MLVMMTMVILTSFSDLKRPKILHDDVSVIVRLQEPVSIIKMVAVHIFEGLQQESQLSNDSNLNCENIFTCLVLPQRLSLPSPTCSFILPKSESSSELMNNSWSHLQYEDDNL